MVEENNQESVPAKRSYDTSTAGEVQVMGSPQKQPTRLNNGGQKRPTSRFSSPGGRLASVGSGLASSGGYKPSSSLNGTRSPYFKDAPGSGRVDSPSATSPVQSSSSSLLAKYSAKMTSSNVQRSPSVPGQAVTKPASATSATALTETQKSNLARLQRIFSKAPPQDLKRAVLEHESYKDAADWLAKRSNRKKMSNQFQRPPSAAEVRSSKVELQKSNSSIAQRYGAKTTRTKPQDHDDDDVNLIQPLGSKKKLVKGPQGQGHRGGSAPPAEQQPEYSSDSEAGYESDVDEEFEHRLLDFLNTAEQQDVTDIASCNEKIAQMLVNNRPYETVEAAQELRLEPKKPGSRKKPEGEKMVNEISSTLKGYEAVDSLIRKCDEVGKTVKKGIEQWGVAVKGNNAEISLTDVTQDDTTGGAFFRGKPSLLADDVELKSYQQVGVNWINLLYKKKLSCILADEMGLGKTCQVIAFLAHLKESGQQGPHLVVVPSSTLENWLREFQRFAPSFEIFPYYGSQQEREGMRDSVHEEKVKFDVMVTTYNLACGSKEDGGFLRSRGFDVCIYDEGHLLKNSDSERFNKLMRIKANFRLLLTGTPLQNNLKELISLLSFILPDMFTSRKQDLSVIFKHRALVNAAQSGRNPLLSEQRIQKAKTMMTPFVLRRKKDQVLQHLPPKKHTIEYCDMDDRQRQIYNDQLEAARKRAEARENGESVKLVNAMMDLRKAAVHPLLFRLHYTNEILRTMASEIKQESVYLEANEQYIYEDMEVMTDFELHVLCEQFPNTIGHRRLEDDEFMKSAKVAKLAKMLPEMKQNGDRVLVFSQFTQVLDILERCLSNLEMRFLRLDGQTAVNDRQAMIDTFSDDKDITVFLLSTRAGGFGINLASANTVIIHDLSFNPHDDRQAEDRAHRVGQTRDVNVVRMITKDTIDENILNLANTKLELDASVTDNNNENGEEPKKEHDRKENANASLIADQVLK